MAKEGHPTVSGFGAALALVDADKAPGAVAMHRATETVAQLAKAAGSACVLVRHTTHTGALGCYIEQLAEVGLVGIAMAASGPHMVYHGAAAAGVSTGPLAIGVPGLEGQPPVILDMASSAIALGKIAQARLTGDALPDGAAVDADGQPTIDATKAVTPLPLGGPKGSGLSLMMELLCSCFTGAGILAPALAAGAKGAPHRQNAMVMALDLTRLSSAPVVQRELRDLFASLKALPRAGDSPIFLPGEIGSMQAATRQRSGIPLPAALAVELERMAKDSGVDTPWQS
jgi:LDH2 family malate/lactate/ureidoglycolate dehydrogenase